MAAQPPSETNWGCDTEQKKMDEREKLRQYFLSLKPEEQVRGWDDMWQKSITPWDRPQPNPALLEALQKKPNIFGSPLKDDKTRKKVLIPGCGRGHDVLLFSSYGFDAYGLDASPTAVQEARKLLAEQDKSQMYPLQHIQLGRGGAKFVDTDFFANDFLNETHSTPSSNDTLRTFDLIYDYTFLCALPPSFRPRWASRMSQLLSPDGCLVCIEFPLGKDPKLGGPPHGLERETYEQLFARPGQELVYNDSGHVCEDRSGEKAENALMRVDRWVPERTFDAQKGQVAVSVWKHWKKA